MSLSEKIRDDIVSCYGVKISVIATANVKEAVKKLNEEIDKILDELSFEYDNAINKNIAKQCYATTQYIDLIKLDIKDIFGEELVK